MRCPICNRVFKESDEKAAPPFCSSRCKQIDAKRWLNEEYSVESVNLDRLEEEMVGVDDAPPEDSERN